MCLSTSWFSVESVHPVKSWVLAAGSGPLLVGDSACGVGKVGSEGHHSRGPDAAVPPSVWRRLFRAGTAISSLPEMAACFHSTADREWPGHGWSSQDLWRAE